MTSQVIIETFRGSATLAGTTPGTRTGISSAVWAAVDQTGAAATSAYVETGSGGTLLVPGSGVGYFARLDFGDADFIHSASTSVWQCKVKPDAQFRIALDFEDRFVAIECGADGAGRWIWDNAGSFVNGSFTATAPGALVTLRIEASSTQTRYYVDDVLQYTHSSGIPYGLTIDWARIGYPRVFAAHGMTPGATVLALDSLHIVTETTSGPLVSSSGAIMAAEGPLGIAQTLGSVRPRVTAAAPSVLRAAALLVKARPVGLVAVPGPLVAAKVVVEHDFTELLEASGATEFWACDLVDAGITTRVPISSWQGTLQIDGACYLQAVVPAISDLAEIINALSPEAEFVISRCARLAGGAVVENEMARSLVEQRQLDQGPQRYTCTLSGYSAAIAAPDGDGPPVRILRGVRSISSGTGGARARCDISWYLRPGAPAMAGAVLLVADYINYYVGGRDAYMDVGERA